MVDREVPFEAFFAEYYESVFRGLAVAFRDPLLAEEAAQEAFTRAYVRWSRVSRMERPAGWVYVVAFRIALSSKRRPVYEQTDGSEGGMRSVEGETVDRVMLQQAIGDLPRRQRVALVLRHYADLPLGEIATAMDCAIGTVKSTLHDAHARLQIELDDGVPEVDLDAP